MIPSLLEAEIKSGKNNVTFPKRSFSFNGKIVKERSILEMLSLRSESLEGGTF